MFLISLYELYQIYNFPIFTFECHKNFVAVVDAVVSAIAKHSFQKAINIWRFMIIWCSCCCWSIVDAIVAIDVVIVVAFVIFAVIIDIAVVVAVVVVRPSRIWLCQEMNLFLVLCFFLFLICCLTFKSSTQLNSLVITWRIRGRAAV